MERMGFAPNHLKRLLFVEISDEAGFEPAEVISLSSFQDYRIKPLYHPSKKEEGLLITPRVQLTKLKITYRTYHQPYWQNCR